jgi:hypothetical protein
MVIQFPYFMTAGANTFTFLKLGDSTAMLGELSFVSGMLCVLCMGLFSAAIFALCSVTLRMDPSHRG